MIRMLYAVDIEIFANRKQFIFQINLCRTKYIYVVEEQDSFVAVEGFNFYCVRKKNETICLNTCR